MLQRRRPITDGTVTAPMEAPPQMEDEMTTQTTRIETSKTYEDYDDCLTAARVAVAEREGVEEWQCTAVWGDASGEPDTTDMSRETIIVTIR
jgi:hypothetical protein